MAIIPKLEATPAVITSPHRAKECLLCESEEIIIEFVIIAETNNIKMRFLKSDLYWICLASSPSLISVQV